MAKTDKKIFFINWFLWHQEEWFAKALKIFCSKKNIEFYTFDFPGHREKKWNLLNVEEMVELCWQNLQKLSNYKNYIILWHSQGWTIATRLVYDNKLDNELILAAPSFNIGWLPDRRLSSEELTILEKGDKLVKDFWRERLFTIDNDFVHAYKNFLPKNFEPALSNKVTIIQAGNDPVISADSIKLSKNYYLQPQIHIIEWANHTFLPKSAREQTFTFIEKIINNEQW